MKTYLVGGAVRDQLLKRPVHEKDWVVVGSTPEEMLSQGFKPVGKDFPVFLHPETKEEYALARTERKTAKGYKGFVFHATPDVTLEEDLKRRDLTINAMAQSEDGKLIDPFNGQEDIKQKQLRHVSPAFAEDPVRILRLARFAARFPDFSVHPETNELMQEIVKNEEVDALVPERVWKELEKGLNEAAPERFFEVLKNCGALKKLFPEVMDANAVSTRVLAKSLQTPLQRFAALMQPLELDTVKTLCQRFRIPGNYQALASLVSKYFSDYSQILDYNSEQILTLLESCDAFRRPERFEGFLQACEACDKERNAKKTDLLTRALKAAGSVDTTDLQQQNLQGKKFAEAVKEKRLFAVKTILAA